jgi:dTMP kinase
MKMTILPSFIVLEGLDGAGTSTQLSLLSKRLKHSGTPHTATWEPTDGPVGKLLRAILAQDVKMLPATIAMLYAADRHEHVNALETGILARASRGELVISDRYVFSSLAYQSVECGFDFVLGLNSSFPLPRCLIFIDTPVEVSQKRLSGRGKAELFDGQSFQARVRENYLAAIERYRSSGMEMSIIKGDRPKEDIHEEIWKIISGLPITGM